MINNTDVIKYFDNNTVQKSFSELSINKESKEPLVNSDVLAYDYEECASRLFASNPFKMVDALYLKGNTVWLIEFKGGFNLKIPLNNFDMSKWYCDNAKQVCEEGAKIFKENQSFKISELIDSIKGKLLETYITFFRLIIPECNACDNSYKIKYVSVVDAVSEPISAIDGILNDLGKTTPKEPSVMARLKTSISKYKIMDKQQNPLLFDEILVWSIEEFKTNLCNT